MYGLCRRLPIDQAGEAGYRPLDLEAVLERSSAGPKRHQSALRR